MRVTLLQIEFSNGRVFTLTVTVAWLVFWLCVVAALVWWTL